VNLAKLMQSVILFSYPSLTLSVSLAITEAAADLFSRHLQTG
jgi:hypothetical protein